MSDLIAQIAALPPEKLALLTLRNPLSFAQQRLWFLDQFQPGQAVYTLVQAVQLDGALDIAALTQSFMAIAERHAILRTIFPTIEGRPLPISTPTPLPFTLVDLSRLPAVTRDQQVFQRIRAGAASTFDLARGPLWRVCLVRLSSTEHVLVLAMHHIISDAWSMRIFVEELAALYTAQRAGRPAALAELPIQYADFATWEREWLQGAALAAQLDYWKEALKDAAFVLELPTDRPRPAALTFNGAVQRFQVDAGLIAALKPLTQRAGATLFMALLAAFQVLLQRYSSQEHFIIGSPTANREQDEVGGLIGFFVNMLALPADLSGQPTFRELLLRVRPVALGAYAHQALPFEKLVEELRPARDPSHSPLFQVAFALQNVPLPTLALGELTLRPIAVHNATAKFDLMLELVETPAGLSATIEYNTDLFDAATITRMAGHFRMLLANAASMPDQRIASLPLLRAAEQHQILVEWQTLPGAASPATLPALFEAQAERTPNAIAVVCDDAATDARRTTNGELSGFVLHPSSVALHMTYRELNQRANQLAQYLRQRGVGAETLVALCVERSIDMIVGVLGILKAGGAYVPLDPAYPPARLAFMLEDSRAQVLITAKDEGRRTKDDETHAESHHDLGLTITDVRAAETPIVHRTSKIVHADNLAYVLYTSGSTGIPKGVGLTQRGAVALIDWARATYPLAALQRVLAATSLGFDLSVYEIFVPLSVGGALVLVDQALALAELDAKVGVTLINSVPSAVAELARLAGIPASVRTANLAGEPLSRALVDQLYALDSLERVYNLYGPTEATTYATCALVPRTDARPPSIGRPIAQTSVYLLDAQMRPVPIGVAGELYIGGVGLARGYHQRPDLTAERFVPNPFADCRSGQSTPGYQLSASGYRLYKTGDLARWQADGQIMFLGRRDQQVKLRGFRIELGEIEAVLAAHPAIGAAVVVVREDRPGDPHMVAYVVAPNGESADSSFVLRPSSLIPEQRDSSFVARPSSFASELRAFLKARLPDYMLPSALVLLDALPRTASGKVDRRALPAPLVASAEQAFVAPRSPAEEVIAGIWMEILNLQRLGIHDNFFELGGHSLLATQVISRITKTFQIALPVRALFDAPTVAELAALIQAAQLEAPEGLLPPLHATATPGAQPLSFAQERLWFLDQLAPGNPTYNLPAALRLRGQLDMGALGRSWLTIIERHASLRTTFSAIDGQPVQHLSGSREDARRNVRGDAPLPLIDLSGLPETLREAEAQRLVAATTLRPFDLRAGPLWRALLVRLAESEHVALLVVHHIVTDGWSMGLLMRELTTLYAAFAQGQPSPLPALPIQYVDFALWQREWLRGPARDHQLTYWKEQLQGLTPLELPLDRPRPPVQTYRGATQTLTLARELTDALAALSRSESVTLYMTLLAAFQALLHRYTGQTDIAVGTPIAGRNHSEIENLIGFFINTLVMRTQLDGAGGLSFRELLRRVRRVCLDAYAHQDIPFEHLLEALHPARDLSRTPLFQVFFNMLNFPDIAMNLRGLTVAGQPLSEFGAKFDLTLQVQEQPDGLRLTAIYNTDLLDAARVAELLAQYQQLLAQATDHPEAAIGSYSLVTPSARLVLPDPAAALGADWVGAVHQLFARQVRRVPNQLAVLDRVESWTYAELERRSNQLAHGLRAQGVRPQDVVAIYAHRSAALVWALLGVLKAGAAFVVLDPAFPPARLVDYLTLATPRALVQVAAAGPFAPEVETCLAALALRGRFVLPTRASAEAQRLFAEQPTHDPAIPVGADDLACVAFTSGSTGKPKGILGRHGPLTHFIPWVCATFELHETDRFSLLAGIAFDMLQREIFTALYLGATVCIPDPDQMGTPGWLADWMRRQAISVVHLTPATGQLLTEGATVELPALRRSFFIGEALTRWSVARLWRLAPTMVCINLYGLTEAQRAVSYFVVPAGAAAGRETLPVGRGMPNLQLLIVNAAGQLAGVGELGEIYFRTPHLAIGYLGDPELTAERFVPDPFATLEDERRRTKDEAEGRPLVPRPSSFVRLYKTGDLGRYLPDGNVESLGRADLQVKLRGFRIELGEIEAALNAHPAVRESVVVAQRLPRPAGRAQPPEELVLVAYVVAQPTVAQPIPADELRRFLRTRLPDYMLPTAFVFLDALPLNSHSKVDRLALPLPAGLRPQLSTELVAPRTELEAELVAIWADVLDLQSLDGQPALGIHDNFFQLGGHSLLATRVISRLRERVEVELPLQALFENPTVAELALALAEKQAEQQAHPVRHIERIRHDTTDQLLESLDQLSEEGLDALLEALLSERDPGS
jgi:amino acid adenylation domain-containing protein